jgi:epsilon-lactone hydrolase
MRTPRSHRIVQALLLCTVIVSATAYADGQRAHFSDDGTVTTPPITLPYSMYASPQSRIVFSRVLQEGRNAPGFGPSIEPNRAYYDHINSDRAARMEKLYPVKIHAESIGGVPTDVVLPAQGISRENQHRVLINLHGGAFLWGAHSGGLVESVPIAGIGRIKVISVDYRQGPEHTFPAASDDVEAVYRALLKQYKPSQIGIYGCSAGGILTAEATARLISDKLPVPGAIGTFCGSLVDISGDSSFVAPALMGEPVSTKPLKLADLPYFKGANLSDPLVFPGASLAILRRFPPTLLITGTRDMTMSSVIQSQALLAQAGVDAELHVWDGMWHSFFSDPEMPESQAAYRTIVAFFDHHLGH